MFKGYRTIVFFAAVSLTGIIAMLQSANIEAILLPAFCHVTLENLNSLAAAHSMGGEVPTSCVTKVVKISGAIMAAVGIIGKILRFITTGPVFKP